MESCWAGLSEEHSVDWTVCWKAAHWAEPLVVLRAHLMAEKRVASMAVLMVFQLVVPSVVQMVDSMVLLMAEELALS